MTTSAENRAGKRLRWGFQIRQDLGMKGPKPKTKSDAVNLYWVITDDHDEDWLHQRPEQQGATTPSTKDTTRATLMLN